MAGFRNGRGRAGRPPQAQAHPHPRQQPYDQGAQGRGAPGHGGPGVPPYAPGPPQQHGYPNAEQQWAQGEPEYFGDGGGYDPYAANNPGHTQAFGVGVDPYTDGRGYRAGQAPAPPIGPRLHWKDLISGVIFRPKQTFLLMRDYTMWGPALIVTFLYGLLAVFGFSGARDDAIHTTFASAVPVVLITAAALVISSVILGAVTHTMARQLGGDGAWQPTVGLSMLIMSLTDAPRLVFAMFMGGDASFVRVLGAVTWIAAGSLLTLMVSRSHDLPWPKALGASSIQLIALLSILKLGTF